MHRRIPISIRKEAGAAIALAMVTVLVAAAIAAVNAGGDQRAVRVLNVFPGDGDTVPVALGEVTITFDRPVSQSVAEETFRIEPALDGAFAWQGNTMRYRLAGPPAPAEYTVTIESGTLGRRDERLPSGLASRFTVRAAGLLAVRQLDGETSALVAIRDGREEEIARTGRVSDLSVAADGSLVAVTQVIGTALVTALIDPSTGALVREIGTAELSVANAAWGPSALLAAVRSELLAPNDYGAGRLWFVRTSGELVAEVDESGEPTLGAAWAPNGQWLLYVAPASAELRLRNMATGEIRVEGSPRASNTAWSPNSSLFAFESAAETVGEQGLRQPVRVAGIAGTVDLMLGDPGEVRLQPAFVDNATLATGRLLLGDPSSLAIVLESIEDGREIASIPLGRRGFIYSMEMSPSGPELLVVTKDGAEGTALLVDVETGHISEAAAGVTHAAWLP